MGVTQYMRFWLERLLLRGAGSRLLVMAGAIVLVAVLGGVGLVALGEPEGLGDAVWWAFLRLTDPGYLGDDLGLGRRSLSTAITVAGYVLFMGALIAILTTWLNATITRLQRGETPVALRNHIVVLGLTDRTPLVVAEMMRSQERAMRRIIRGRARSIRIVVLVEDLDEEVRTDLKERIGERWDDKDIILRSGSPLNDDHLERVALSEAAAILVPGGSERDNDPDLRDSAVVKTLLSVASHPGLLEREFPPRLVAELHDARLADIVERAHPGMMELLPGDTMVARLMAQNLRHHGLSWVLDELMAFSRGNEIHYPELPGLAGERWIDVARRLRGGVSIGMVRPVGRGYVPLLNPDPDERVRAKDRLVVIARRRQGIHLGPPAGPLPAAPALPPLGHDWPELRRVLVLGWGPRVVPFIAELETYTHERFEVELLSVVPIEQREAELRRAGVEVERVALRHLEGDYTNVLDLQRFDLASYHNVLVNGRTWHEDQEDSDAQTLLAALILHSLLPPSGPRPSLVVELMDADNVRLLHERPGEVILSPLTLGNMMAHIAMRRELHVIIDELFTVGGTELHYRPAADFQLSGSTLFGDIQDAALSSGEVAIGIRTSDAPLDVRGDLVLAPAHSERFDIDTRTLIVVLTTAEPAPLDDDGPLQTQDI